MPNDQDQPAPPKGLAASGRKLWKSVICDCAGQGLSLDSRELIWLEQAARLADRIAELEDRLAGDDFVVREWVSGGGRESNPRPKLPDSMTLQSRSSPNELVGPGDWRDSKSGHN